MRFMQVFIMRGIKMSKLSVLLWLVVFVAVIPMTAGADTQEIRQLANLAIDHADDMLLAAEQLFHEKIVAGQWYPPELNGDEVIRFLDQEKTAREWLQLADKVHEKAWDDLIDGQFNRSIRKSHRTIIIAKLLIEKADRQKLASLTLR